MTIGEVNTVINCYVDKTNEEVTQKNHLTYNLAYLTARFVSHTLSGHSIPSYEDIYEPEEGKGDSWIYYKEKLIDYKDEWNKHIEKQGGK